MTDSPHRDPRSDPPPGWGDAPPPPTGETPPVWQQQAPPSYGEPASVGKRVAALLLDSVGLLIVLSIALFVVTLVTGLLARATSGGGTYVSTLIMSLATLAYFALLEAGSGQTIAKRLLRIKAVAADGSALTLQQAALRRVPFVVGGVIPTFLGDLVTMALLLGILVTAIQDEPLHRGLHDRWAGSQVIEV